MLDVAVSRPDRRRQPSFVNGDVVRFGYRDGLVHLALERALIHIVTRAQQVI